MKLPKRSKLEKKEGLNSGVFGRGLEEGEAQYSKGNLSSDCSECYPLGRQVDGKPSSYLPAPDDSRRRERCEYTTMTLVEEKRKS